MSTPKRGIGAYTSGQGGGTAKGNNYLLVIGIDTYQHFPRLNNAVRDAQTFVELLQERYQFKAENTEVLFDENATERQLLFKLRDLARLITPDDNLVIYFSGHGEYDEILNEGYWIPVDAEQGALEDFIPNSKIHTVLNAIQSRHTFLIVDSCFSGSLFMQYRSGAGSDRLETLPSRWGLTSGRNEVVPDGPTGHHSPFAESLLNQLRLNRDALGVADLCQRVVESVAGRSQQIPRGEPMRVNGHEGGPFFFRLQKQEAVRDSVPKPTSSPSTKGGLLYSIPQAMELGQESRCEVRIAFDKASLLKDFDTGKDYAVRDVRISNLMEVELIDPLLGGTDAFQVRTISSAEQFIDPDDYTQWVFYVKAMRAGLHPLVLKVTVIETIGGKERRKEIVLEEQVEVRTEVVEVPPTGWRESGYSFSMGKASPGGLEIDIPQVVQPSPFPEGGTTAPSPHKVKSRGKRIHWIRNAAAIFILVFGVIVVVQWMIQTDSGANPVDRESEYVKVRNPLTEAREMLEQKDANLPQAEELLNEARKNADAEGGDLPEPLVRELEEVESLFREKHRIEMERNPGLIEEEELPPGPSDEQLEERRRRSGEEQPDDPGGRPMGSFLDQRNGQRYPVVELYGMFWMQSNLGFPMEGMVCYKHRPIFCDNFGGLYNWDSAREACPPGWHLPTLGEWDELVVNFGGYDSFDAFQTLGRGGGSFFEAKLGGIQEPGGQFRSMNEEGLFWTLDPESEKEAIAIVFEKRAGAIHQVPVPKAAKLSCRCVQD